jgi:hypothetical protein
MTHGSGVMVTAGWGYYRKPISRQIKLSGQVWSLRPLPKEIWKNPEYKYPRYFHNLSNER